MFQEKDRQMTAVTGGSEEERAIEAQVLALREQFALYLSRYVAGTAIAMIVSMVIVWLFFRQYTQLLALAGDIVLVAVGAGLYSVLHRRGRATTGIHILLLSFLLVVATMNLLIADVTPVIGVGYVAIILMGNLLLGDKNSRWLTGACILAFTADLILVNTWTPGWFTPLDKTVGLIISVSFGALASLGAALIVHLVVAGQEEQFRRARLANLEIEGRAAAGQKQREQLQAMVAEYMTFVANVARGNLTTRLTLDGDCQQNDPLLILGYNLNEMVDNLRDMTARTREAAQSLGSAAAEILAATTQQVAGASEQSAAISQTTTTVDEVKTIAEQSAVRSQEVADTSRRTVEVSRSGQQAVQDTIESMAQIKERVEGIAENILTLSEQTQQIGEIITTVNEIAAQSNMLALNASVEAARAGEHGKGFAVVAVEVRNLAEQSKQATAQVKAILSDIQKATNATVMATEEAAKGVDEGVRLSAQTREALDRLYGAIAESAQTATQVVVSGQQQSVGIEQIALAMQNINQATTQNLASTRQAERAAQDLNELARRLTTTVEQYQL